MSRYLQLKTSQRSLKYNFTIFLQVRKLFTSGSGFREIGSNQKNIFDFQI